MPGKNIAATEETGAVPVAPSAATGGEAKASSRTFLLAAHRPLTDKEAASPAGVRWLMYDVERLDEENAALKFALDELSKQYDGLRDRYSEQRVELETLRGASNISVRNEALSYLALTVGGTGLGASTTYLGVVAAGSLPLVGLCISAVLVVGGLVLRRWK